MADRDSLVEQFVGVTGIDSSRARFYLESAAWDLELAMSSFFEGSDRDHDDPEQSTAIDDVSMASDLNTVDRTDAANSNRIQTFRSIHVESDSSDEEGQAYFAGGSDRSGQQILGPPKKKDANKLVDNLFKSAREHGAEEKRDEEQLSETGRSAFVGAGYRLGETHDDTTFVAGASQPQAREQVYKKLKLWKTGYSIDNGPLRDYNDPDNKQFLESVARGEVPQELVREAKGGEVNLDMEDHRSEDYVKPKASVKAFSGAGHMLGSPTPNVIRSTPPAGDRAPPAVNVDETKPVTNVQLRLADGKRLVLKLNHTHTIGDIRQHIIATNPLYAQSSFSLMTTFPNKELTDESLTLEEAKLLNAVIVQKMK